MPDEVDGFLFWALEDDCFLELRPFEDEAVIFRLSLELELCCSLEFWSISSSKTSSIVLAVEFVGP